jgi:hypothetical protein
VSSASSMTFEDVKVGVRFKIAALWIAMLFLFAYGDIFGFFSPGQIEEVMAGKISGMAITEVFPVRGLALHRDRERDGVPLAGPRPDRQPLGQHCLAKPVRRLHRGLGDRRDVGVLLVPEHHRECPSAAGRLVRVDVAQAGGSTLRAVPVAAGAVTRPCEDQEVQAA